MPRTHAVLLYGATAVWALLAGAAPLAGQAARDGSGPQEFAAAAWTPFLGGSLVAAAVPSPFASGCGGANSRRVDYDLEGIGLQASAGVRSSRGWDVRVRYTGIAEFGSLACTLIVRTEPDGIHRRKTYEQDLWGEGLRTIGLQAGYSPPALHFVRIAAGAGVEWDRGVPFVLGGADLRLGSRVQLVAGVDVLLLHTPYVVLDEEWENGRNVSTELVRDGGEWRRSWLVRLGAEFAVGRR